MKWEIDPVTFSLTGGPNTAMSAREFASQEWPPCPVCGSRIDVDRVPVQSVLDQFPVYMVSHWRCDLGCDPRKDQRPRYHATGRLIFAQRGPDPGDDDLLVGMMDSAELAELMVKAVNVWPVQRRNTVPGGLPDFDG